MKNVGDIPVTRCFHKLFVSPVSQNVKLYFSDSVV